MGKPRRRSKLTAVRSVVPKVLSELGLDEARAAVGPRQEDALEFRGLARALAKLPDEQRQVILLVGLEEMSYAEAAGVLGLPIGTVLSPLSPCRRRFPAHRALARWTLPLWLYVSVTGVIVYWMLYRVPGHS